MEAICGLVSHNGFLSASRDHTCEIVCNAHSSQGYIVKQVFERHCIVVCVEFALVC